MLQTETWELVIASLADREEAGKCYDRMLSPGVEYEVNLELQYDNDATEPMNTSRIPRNGFVQC